MCLLVNLTLRHFLSFVFACLHSCIGYLSRISAYAITRNNTPLVLRLSSPLVCLWSASDGSTLGRYSSDGVDCVECLSGYHTNAETEATACEACDAGRFSAGKAFNCTICPAGKSSKTTAIDCDGRYHCDPHMNPQIPAPALRGDVCVLALT